MSTKESILEELVQPKVEEPDALSVVGVFGEKSKAVDSWKDRITEKMSELSDEDIFDIASSVSPVMGSIKAGKGVMSFLKGLLGRAKPKTTRAIPSEQYTDIMNYFETKKLQNALHRLSDPEKFSRLAKIGLEKPSKEISDIMKLQKGLSQGRPVKALTKKEYNEAWKALNKMSEKPKGMRQFGKFNRQKWEK